MLDTHYREHIQRLTLPLALAGIGGLLIGLYLTSLHSYLLFHAMIELVSIAIAWGVWMIAWNTRRYIENTYVQIIAAGYAFIGGIDLLHTLAYKGMGVFPGYDANLPTQLWIGARYLQSLMLLAAPLLIGRPGRLTRIVPVYLAVVSGYLAALFVWPVFPDCFVEGLGLTPFKIGSEYLICGILAEALFLLMRQRRTFDPGVFRWLVFSLVVTIVSELAFTFYVSVYGLSNLVGHYFKLAAFYAVYRAIIATGLRQPFSLLFRELQARETALRESEERFRLAFDTSPDAIAINRLADGLYVDINRRFTALTGFTRQDAIGKTSAAIDIWHDPADRQRLTQSLQAAGDCENLEAPFRRKDGSVTTALMSARILTLQGVPHILSTTRDIAARKQTEEERERLLMELKKRTIEMDTVFNVLPFLVSIHAPDGRYLRVNPALIELFGFDPTMATREEIASRLQAHFPDGRVLTPQNMPSTRALNGETVAEVEYLITDAQGKKHTILFNGMPLQVEGHVYGAVFAQIDITDRKQAEEALRAVQMRTAAILEGIADTFYALDNHWRFTMVNPAAEKAPFGRPKAELLGRLIWDVYPGLVGTPIHQHYLSAAARHDVEHYEAQSPLNGRWYEVFMQGWAGGVDIYMRDINDRKQTEEALRESETKYRTLVENAADAIYLLDRNYVVLSANTAAAALWGKEPGELIGRSLSDLFPPKIAARYTKSLQNLFATGASDFSESRLVVGEKEFWTSVRLNPVRDPDGQVSAIMGVTRDITERKQAEEALRESEEKFRNLVGDMQVGVLLQGSQAEILLSNPKSLELLGIDEDQLLGKTSFDPEWNVIHEDGSPFPGPSHPVPQAIATRHSVSNVVMGVYRPTTGDRVWLSVDAKPRLNDDGTVRQVICSFIDITARKQAEEALREAQARYRILFEEAPLPLWEQDLSGVKRYLDNLRASGVTDVAAYFQAHPAELDACAALIRTLDVNETAVAFYQAESKADLRANFHRIFSDASQPGLINGFARIAAGERVCEHDAMNLTFTGAPRFLMIRWAVAPGYADTYSRVLVAATDITDRKQAEEGLRAAHTELLEKNVALHDANASKDKFFSIIAHDLRSPFNGLLGYLDLMDRQFNDLSANKLKDYLAKLKLSASALYALLENLLAWSLMQRGLVEYRPEVIALAPLMNEIVGLFAPNAGQKAITLTPAIPAAVMVSADRAMLNTILRNLVSNALKFTPSGGRIMLSARPAAGDAVEIAVADTGRGMTPDVIAQLFRLDSRHTTTGTAGETGTGLGLLLCHDLARKQGGALTVESAVGAGATFRLTLPLAADWTASDAAGQHASAPGSVSEPSAPSPDDAIILPPLSVLRELHYLARIGDILGIEHFAQELQAQDARYTAAAEQLLRLRKSLQIVQIRELVEEWVQRGAPETSEVFDRTYADSQTPPPAPPRNGEG